MPDKPTIYRTSFSARAGADARALAKVDTPPNVRTSLVSVSASFGVVPLDLQTPQPLSLIDHFARIVAAGGWGEPSDTNDLDPGAYEVSSGAAGDFKVNGATGQIDTSTGTTGHLITSPAIDQSGTWDVYGEVIPGTSINAGVNALRLGVAGAIDTQAGTGFAMCARLTLPTSNLWTAELVSLLAGVPTVLATGPTLGVTGVQGGRFGVHLSVTPNTVSGSAWLSSDSEPGAFQCSSPQQGTAGLRMAGAYQRQDAGAGGAVFRDFDNLVAGPDPNAPFWALYATEALNLLAASESPVYRWTAPLASFGQPLFYGEPLFVEALGGKPGRLMSGTIVLVGT